jgi:hypothetical protein
MNETKKEEQREFREWMVTQALAKYLESQAPERMDWFFKLPAETPSGTRTLAELCGFSWQSGKVEGGAEDAFKEEDRGKIPLEEFKKTYWTTAADFRYWTQGRERQLLVEAKGTAKPTGRRDDVQAIRYFKYFQETGFTGAVIYVVPDPFQWVKWLEDKAKETIIPFGVVNVKSQIVPTVANELVRVVGNGLVQSAALLEEALRISKSS